VTAVRERRHAVAHVLLDGEREAWAYAKLGRVSAFRRATAKAEDALIEAKPSEDPLLDYLLRHG